MEQTGAGVQSRWVCGSKFSREVFFSSFSTSRRRQDPSCRHDAFRRDKTNKIKIKIKAASFLLERLKTQTRQESEKEVCKNCFGKVGVLAGVLAVRAGGGGAKWRRG